MEILNVDARLEFFSTGDSDVKTLCTGAQYNFVVVKYIFSFEVGRNVSCPHVMCIPKETTDIVVDGKCGWTFGARLVFGL